LETVEGAIFVDGDDISKRNLFTHRTSINIIPQVPIFNSGSSHSGRRRRLPARLLKFWQNS
jgi:ABC-type multidrug transport system fused ATPase/permease subunit